MQGILTRVNIIENFVKCKETEEEKYGGGKQ